MEKDKIAIVIPAWNEEQTIQAVVASVKAFGTVVVVNDASSDKTPELAKQAGAMVVSHAQNKGIVVIVINANRKDVAKIS